MPARGEAGQDRAQSSSRMDSACGFRDAALQGGFQAAPARDPPHRRGCHPRRTSLYGSEDTLEAPPPRSPHHSTRTLMPSLMVV
jgi:hypothetical protein